MIDPADTVAMVSADIGKKLDLIRLRIDETWGAFIAEKKINELGCSCAEIKQSIDMLGHAWGIILFSLQSTWIIGVSSLLDNDNGKCSIHNVLNALNDRSGYELSGIIKACNKKREKYRSYRNNLFSHLHNDRVTLAERFDGDADFNFIECENDICFIDYAFKAAYSVNNGNGVPTEDMARNMCFRHNASVKSVASHVEMLLRHCANLT